MGKCRVKRESDGEVLVGALVRAGGEGEVKELVGELVGDGGEEQVMVRERVREAVRLEVVEGRSLPEVAREMGVGVTELRRWRRRWREYWLEAYEDVLAELDEEREGALRRVEVRLARQSEDLVRQLEGLVYGGGSERVRLRALEVALRLMGGEMRRGGSERRRGRSGRVDGGVGKLAAELKAVAKEVNVYMRGGGDGE